MVKGSSKRNIGSDDRWTGVWTGTGEEWIREGDRTGYIRNTTLSRKRIQKGKIEESRVV